MGWGPLATGGSGGGGGLYLIGTRAPALLLLRHSVCISRGRPLIEQRAEGGVVQNAQQAAGLSAPPQCI
jgi:hypothetical protein